MTKTTIKLLLVLPLLFWGVSPAMAQDGSAKATEKEEDGPKLQFNGLGRTFINQTGIDGDILENDTLTPRGLTDGEFLLDLQINATPNDKTEIQSILRLRNEFGGFFGAGMTVEVRELWARGIIGNVVEYRVGDMDLERTPYTLFNFQEEGTINEPSAFQPQKELIYYEQFYNRPNSRRYQGGSFDFGLQFTEGIRDMDVNAFLARIRGTDFIAIPTRLVSGADIQFSTYRFSKDLGSKADFGFNLVHTFDDLNSGEANTGIRNTVGSFSFDLTVLENKDKAVHVLGETGLSWLENKNDSVLFYESDDSFLDIGASLVLKPQKLKFQASFVDVGPEFFSMAAQSRRIDYNAEKRYFNRAGEGQEVRPVSLFDISRDPAIYTFELSDQLMAYDPRFTNTFPYGKATPNRRGVNLGADYGMEGQKLEARLDASFMSEIRGQGTEELKNFALVKAAATLNIDQYIGWNNGLHFTFGYQFEQTSRGGNEFEEVDLTSNLIELGFEAELFKDFEVLLGAKMLVAEGSDYVPRISEFNIVEDFPGRTVVDDTETLLAGGIRYNFKEGIYVTLQYHWFDAQTETDNFANYRIDQVFVLYTMNF
jgi:hypothetical protein